MRSWFLLPDKQNRNTWQLICINRNYFCVNQDMFSLANVLEKADDFVFNKQVFSQNDHEKVIAGFVSNLL